MPPGNLCRLLQRCGMGLTSETDLWCYLLLSASASERQILATSLLVLDRQCWVIVCNLQTQYILQYLNFLINSIKLLDILILVLLPIKMTVISILCSCGRILSDKNKMCRALEMLHSISIEVCLVRLVHSGFMSSASKSASIQLHQTEILISNQPLVLVKYNIFVWCSVDVNNCVKLLHN